MLAGFAKRRKKKKKKEKEVELYLLMLMHFVECGEWAVLGSAMFHVVLKSPGRNTRIFFSMCYVFKYEVEVIF